MFCTILLYSLPSVKPGIRTKCKFLSNALLWRLSSASLRPAICLPLPAFGRACLSLLFVFLMPPKGRTADHRKRRRSRAFFMYICSLTGYSIFRQRKQKVAFAVSAAGYRYRTNCIGILQRSFVCCILSFCTPSGSGFPFGSKKVRRHYKVSCSPKSSAAGNAPAAGSVFVR